MMFLEQDPVITITVARMCGVRTALICILLQHGYDVNGTCMPVCVGYCKKPEELGLNGMSWDHVCFLSFPSMCSRLLVGWACLFGGWIAVGLWTLTRSTVRCPRGGQTTGLSR